MHDYPASELSADADAVLKAAQDCAATPSPATLTVHTRAAEPPRQELFRSLKLMPGGTAAVLGLRRALLKRLRKRPALQVIEADLLHLLSSWVTLASCRCAAACSQTAAVSPSFIPSCRRPSRR